ncbi:MAG: hypothetical protein JOY96_03010, partial [Verrucomicrobia bacterium]|nr:hypothetical protein [Verrucomicrobiota bacterium]
MLFIRYGFIISSLAGSLVLACPLFAKERLSTDIEKNVGLTGDNFVPLVTSYNWGALGSPVIGTSEPTPGYEGAELFAGPSKFVDSADKDYFHGVLPNGRVLKPAGISTQVGMNPLGISLTPDGKYAIISNNDERNGTLTSLQNPMNRGGYSLSVLDTSTSPMRVASQINTAGRFFVGLEAISSSAGGYTLYASGGGDNSIKVFKLTADGTISAATNPAAITIDPTLPLNEGWVSHFIPAPTFNFKSIPSPASSTGVSSFSSGYKSTFPAGMVLSPDSKFLYVACNGDNSLAVIDTTKSQVIAQYPAGYFPYGVSVSSDGRRICLTNWGLTAYKFATPVYDDKGYLAALGTTRNPNLPSGFFVPQTSKEGNAPKSSSVSVFQISDGDPTHGQL